MAASVDWVLRSRETGKITIAQRPNVPLALFLASIPLGWAVSHHPAAFKVVDGIGTVGLGWWAVDEVLRGVNPWRRVLGVAGCALVALRATALLR